MSSRGKLAMLLLICAVPLFAKGDASTRAPRESASLPSEAVLYGVGVAEPGAVVRLQRARAERNPGIDEVLATATTPPSGRWAIRHATATIEQGLYFSIGDASGGVSVLSPSPIDLIPAVPSALIVVRPAQESSDTWRVY